MVRLRILLILAGILFTLIFAYPQENNTITSSGWSFGIGGINIYDQYLSPLVYNGTVFRGDYESMRFVSAKNKHLSIQKLLTVSGGLTQNEAKTNSIFYFGIKPGLGIHYHFRPLPSLKILLGGVWDLTFASKYSFNNGNNPYSADLSTQLNASLLAQYRFVLLKMPIMVRYSLRSPIAGVMFVPEYGASYYEMFTLGHLDNSVHFASVFNSFAWNNAISADLLLKRLTIRFSYTHDYEKHHANSLHFESIQNVFSIGTVVNFSVFDRHNRKAPETYNDINK